MHNNQDPEFQPLFNTLPPAVVALALALFAVEVVLWLAGHGLIGGQTGISWRRDAALQFGFPGTMFDYLAQAGLMTKESQRFFTYPFVHLGFGHVAFVIAFLLALGKLTGEVFGNLSVVIVFFASSIVGALVYAMTGDARPLLGGFPAVYGLIGCYTFILWVGLGRAGENQMRAFSLIGFLMGIQLVFGLIFGSGMDWLAELAGFATGFALCPILAPGGFTRLLDRLRQR